MWGLGDMDIPDAPEIERAERTGLKPFEVPFEEPEVICPVCGMIAETFYENSDGKTVGCEFCIRKKDAYEYQRDAEGKDG